MAIRPLPESTFHLLGSSQAITTATCLIKELIDNALDAKATSIDVLVSQNTIDRIEVRDNGHGIAIPDLNALGRRGHTSKLRAFEELRSLGGSSLGFRGEALASTVQLGNVTVTTRIDGEPVAILVKLKSSGGIDTQIRASHPMGTTVCVVDFMGRLPVRKQVALKKASQTLVEIKDLVQAYAIARSTVRFNLKIIKGGKGSWSFAPRPHGSIRDVISQIIGREATSHLAERYVGFSDASLGENFMVISKGPISIESSPTEPSQGKYVVHALLPQRDLDISRIGNGHFLSVDSRPVSCEKGTMKKIVTMCKKYIRATTRDALGKIKSPFIFIDIKCPIATYDPNVEPAKDDVIFSNEQIILDSIEALCKDLYGDRLTVQAKYDTATSTSFDNLRMLMAQKPADGMASPAPINASLVQQPHIMNNHASPRSAEGNPALPSQENIMCSDDDPLNAQQPEKKRRNWRVNMSMDDSGSDLEICEVHPSSAQNTSISDLGKSTPDLEASSHINSRVIAKLDAPTRPQHANSDARQMVARNLVDIWTDIPNSFKRLDPITPRQSQVRPKHMTVGSCKSLNGDQPWSRKRLENEGHNDTANDEVLLLDPGDNRPAAGFVTARQLNTESLLTPPTTQISKRPKTVISVDKPFTSLSSPYGLGTANSGLHQSKLSLEPKSADDLDSSTSKLPKDPNVELAWAMNFEERKEAAIRHRRAELRASAKRIANKGSHEVVKTSPHKARYEAAVACLESPQSVFDGVTEAHPNILAKPQTSLPDGDPRAYLMRRQKSLLDQSSNSNAPPRSKRAKTMLLPLEKVPAESQTHRLLQNLRADSVTIQTSMKRLADFDLYIRRPGKSVEPVLDPTFVSGIKDHVHEVVTAWISRDERRKSCIEYTFGDATRSGGSDG